MAWCGGAAGGYLGFGVSAFTIGPFGQGKPDLFPDDPEHHRAYENLAKFKARGILVGYPDTLGRGFVYKPSRYEMAVSIHAGLTNLHQIVGQFQAENDVIATRAFIPSDQLQSHRIRMSELGSLLPADQVDLERMIAEFHHEFTEIGVDTTAMILQLDRDANTISRFRLPKPGEALHQFSDVPSNHWAAKATKDLRAVGILHGHNGKFGD